MADTKTEKTVAVHAVAFEAIARLVADQTAYRTSWAPTVEEAEEDLEPSVLEDLAELTEVCGPWDAANRLFNPINERSADVA
ncbi:hypothetical protein ACIBHX_01735 [Nonomuraea sp. NPDC050536]|uniref:hypothetical protein n=1 Tax=Nonomuraea sp. NPDC050536 TaxID=3364366 RepID=UPI0037CACE05